MKNIRMTFLTFVLMAMSMLTACNNGLEAVDLGLPSGTKWASVNVGAKSPADYGDYFAWVRRRLNANTTKRIVQPMVSRN